MRRSPRLPVLVLCVALAGCQWSSYGFDTGAVPDTWLCTCEPDGMAGYLWQAEFCDLTVYPIEDAYIACTTMGGIAYARDCFDCVCLPINGGCG